MAVTPATLTWLESVWKKTETVPGLVLAEPDFITLAQELALRGVPNSEAILSEQIARTQNPDRKERMEFVRPSLSADPAVRDAFFAQLKDPVKRRREAWVLEGIGYLHHPLRAASAEKHVPTSLDMLLEIQKTGDIFFPEALDGRDALGSPEPVSRDRRQDVPGQSAARLSRSAAQNHPVVRR